MTPDPHPQTAFDPRDIWEDYRPTRLIELPELARRVNVGRVFLKDEGERPLGNFKVLGGMVAGLRALARASGIGTIAELCTAGGRGMPMPRLICASDGNHGLAVAAAARKAGTTCSVYLPSAASPERAARIEAMGARVIRTNGTYDDAVREAAEAAGEDAILVPDTSIDPNDRVLADVMAGYSLLTRELANQFAAAGDWPTHLFVQAGVGGLAAAMADGLCDLMRPPAGIAVVEPQSAACVTDALAAGHPVRVPGNLQTSAAMLSCGLASTPALEILCRRRASSVTVTDRQLGRAVDVLRAVGGPATTPSGAAGLAGLLHVAADPQLRAVQRLDEHSSVLLVATEGSIQPSPGRHGAQLLKPAPPHSAPPASALSIDEIER